MSSPISATQLSDGASEHNDSQEDEDDLEGVYTYQYTAPKNDASMAIDIFSSEDEDEEDNDSDDGITSRIVKESMSRVQENMPSESGVIEEVSMKNFMCHARLTIPLGPLINFIIGHNGSGKSAILTALTVCLGAKASVTNRGGKLSDFIKEGEEAAWVSVKIKNQGENAYQPELYGQSIYVERHFSRAGTSSFKIKNSEGRIVSIKKSDMENISDFFALQIDNPMNVLSQDLARQFLSNSTPQDKYKFFIRGTQLEQLDKDYTLLEQYLDECEARNEARQADVAALGEKKRKAEEKKKMMQRTDTIQTQINETGWMFAWAQIEEQERNLAKLDSEVAKKDEMIVRTQRGADDASKIFEEEDGTREATVAVIQDLEDQLQPLKESHQEIKELFDHNKAQLTESLTTQRQIKTDIGRHKSNIATAVQQIAAEHAKIENSNGPAHAQKITEMEEMKAVLPEQEAAMISHRDTKPALDRAVQIAENEAQASQFPIQQKRNELEQAESLLPRLEREQGDQTKAYNPQTIAVVRAIQSERRFRDKPVGPMGFHIQLKKPEWASIIERTVGGNMDAFVVTNKQDQTILSEIMKRNKCNANILIGSSRHIDVSQNEPEPDVDTMLRVLDIDNDLVRNALIINQRIDQTVLIPKRADGSAYAQRRKPNVFSVMSQHDTIRGQGWRFDVTRGGGNKTSPVQKWDRMIRMKTSQEEQIRLQRGTIQHIKQEIDHLQSRLREKQIAVKNAQQAIARHTQEARKHRTAIQRTETRIQELEAELDQDNINDTGVLDELQHQKQEAESELQSARDSYEDSINQKDKIDEAQRVVKADLEAASAAIRELEAKINKARNRGEQRERSRREALHKKNLAIGLLEEAQREREEAVQRREALAAQIESDLIPQAEEVHSRIPVPENMTTDMLDAKLEALVKERDRVQQSIGGSRERIWGAWRAASDAFKKGNKDLNDMMYAAKLIKISLLHRKGRWKKFRKFITTRAQNIFTYLLSERGFRGRILVNHSEKMLDISVEPDITRESDKGRQSRSLSGGEKSFSTICLLLSIWEAMGSPIRCLDEFDVFMDHANREVSMKMMIQAARRSVGRQFILITPQAMTFVEGWQDVKIFKMRDPERGQRTLPYGEEE
ncbi:hypothetical protein AAFC00_006629 [Neodothiora populina]